MRKKKKIDTYLKYTFDIHVTIVHNIELECKIMLKFPTHRYVP